MMKRMHPLRFEKRATSLTEMVRLFGESSYQARTLARACYIYKRMLGDDSIIGLTLAGAMTPAGLGGYIAQMIELGFIDFIVTTGANVTHDTHFPLGGRVVQGSADVNDLDLLKEGVERVYDTYLMPEALTRTGESVRRFLEKEQFNHPISSSEFHYKYGHYLKSVSSQEHPERFSFLISAAVHDVPIWVPAFGDSEIGMGVALYDIDDKERSATVSTSLDVNELCAFVYGAAKIKKTGVITVGGGTPKNFFTQTSPLLLEDIYTPEEAKEHPGHDYIIKITTDTPVYGGCSGATPSENVSWKKLDPEILDSGEVVVHADATIALPLLFGYVFSEVERKPLKRLYAKLPGFLREFETKRAARVKRYGTTSFRKGNDLKNGEEKAL